LTYPSSLSLLGKGRKREREEKKKIDPGGEGRLMDRKKLVIFNPKKT